MKSPFLSVILNVFRPPECPPECPPESHPKCKDQLKKSCVVGGWVVGWWWQTKLNFYISSLDFEKDRTEQTDFVLSLTNDLSLDPGGSLKFGLHKAHSLQNTKTPFHLRA